MRHGDKINNLGRKTAHRHALIMNLAIALIENKRIFTTLAKAKALRTYVEPLITKSKEDTTHSRRMAFAYLKKAAAYTNTDLGVMPADKRDLIAGVCDGYTRIIKTGNRQGDAAEMAMIELVDFNEIYNNKKGGEAAKAKTTRRRGTKKAGAKKGAEPKNEESKGE